MKIILIFLLSFIAYADYGIDTLALPRYTRVVKDSLPYGWWFSSFAETFGNGIQAIDEVNSTGKPKGFRIQLLWSDSHTFGDADIPKIIELSKKVELVAKRYPTIECEISPFCEHNLNNADKYLEIVERYAPSCTPVNTVWKGALSKKYKNEVHGIRTTIPEGKYNWSYDGEDPDADNIGSVRHQYQSAEVFFLWHHKLNAKESLNDKTPVERRSYQLSHEEFQSILKFIQYGHDE